MHAGVAKLADAQDLKSWDSKESCGFDPRPRHSLAAALRDRSRSDRLPFISAVALPRICSIWQPHATRSGSRFLPIGADR